MEFPDMPDPGDNLSSPLSEVISARDKATLDMVREALLKKRVLLAFQPVMQTARPDQVAFYEGFIRVADRKGRIIPARDFMGVVEKQEMGRILDTLALEKGLEALETEPGLRLSINMSARSIGYPRWNRVMEAGLIKDPTIAERLILEITESSAITLPEIVQVFMADMQMKGISFAIDNFGAGYTSLKYLKEFYFDILKIDGSFVRGIARENDDQMLVRAILAFARQFDMYTVAESVENHEDAQVLAEMGVDCMQGYYFGMPTISPYWQNRDQHQRAG